MSTAVTAATIASPALPLGKQQNRDKEEDRELAASAWDVNAPGAWLEDVTLVLFQEFLAKIASKKFEEALSLAKKILVFEPNNKLILEYETVLTERIEQIQQAHARGEEPLDADDFENDDDDDDGSDDDDDDDDDEEVEKSDDSNSDEDEQDSLEPPQDRPTDNNHS